MDKYGHAKLRKLLRNLGESQDLGRSSEAILGASLENVFAAWVEILKTTPKYALPTQPAMVEAFPEQNAVEVRTDMKEIWVTFNVPMRPNICVHTECGNSGICYSNARWASHQKLVIPVVGKLLPKHRYQLSLGSEDGCLLKSAPGVEIPVTPWEFTTGN
jgi:hypothetical protein